MFVFIMIYYLFIVDLVLDNDYYEIGCIWFIKDNIILSLIMFNCNKKKKNLN